MNKTIFIFSRKLLINLAFCTILFSYASIKQESPAIAELPSQPDVTSAIKKIDQVVTAGPFINDWDSLESYQIPQWYRDAKFGIFIHWGVYSVPAFGSEWYPRQMYINKPRRGVNFFEYHKKTYGSQKVFGYKDFIPEFKAEHFDAGEWVRLFKDAGARYIVPVAEHHDGFPMYDCSFTKWNSVRMGPKRDIIRELEKATRNAGLKFGVSSHRAFNWMYYVRDKEFDNSDPQLAGLYGRPMPFLFNKDADDYRKHFPPQDDQFKDSWLARTCEIVDRYQPDLIWFDFGITPGLREAKHNENPFADHLRRFAAYYYNKTMKTPNGIGVINYKWNAFSEKSAVLDKERSKMAEIREPFWQTDTAVSSSSWGYTKDQKYKTPDRLVDDLIDIVSKNGCLLLNVGPRSDGTIPSEDQEILRSIGQWLKINGEAIYGTTHWVTFGEGPTAVSTEHVSEAKDKPFTEADIRFTTRNDVLYALGLKWPSDNSVKIKSLGISSDHIETKIKSVSMLGVSQPLTWFQSEKELLVDLPEEHPSDYAYALKIQFQK